MNNIIIVSMILITVIGLILIPTAIGTAVYAKNKHGSTCHSLRKIQNCLSSLFPSTPANTSANTTNPLANIDKSLSGLFSKKPVLDNATATTTTNQTGNRTSLPPFVSK